MGSQFRVTCHSRFALHREGGKYYQIYSIDLIDKNDWSFRKVVMFHWGKVSMSSEMIPANCGQVSIEVFPQGHKLGAVQAISEKERKKKARGYEFGDWELEFEVTGDSDILEKSRSKFEDLFGGENARDVLGFLKIDELRSAGIETTAVKADVVEADETVEGWGTW